MRNLITGKDLRNIMKADLIKDGEEAMDAYIRELHSMEHIGNYLGKYRQMIAEYDEAKAINGAIDALETLARQQGRDITEAHLKIKDALERLEALEAEWADYKKVTE